MVAIAAKPLVVGVVGSVVAVGSVVVKPLVIGPVGSAVTIMSVAVGSVVGAPSILYQCGLWATSVYFSSYW